MKRDEFEEWETLLCDKNYNMTDVPILDPWKCFEKKIRKAVGTGLKRLFC